MITFVVPTVARPSVVESVNSLIAQTDPNWKALVLFDNIKPEFELPDDDRVSYLFLPRRLGTFHAHGQAGAVRNYGIRRVDTDWIGFLDDDDTITPDYIERFNAHLAETPDIDLLIFRMTMQGAIYPPDGWGIEECKVGISFCARTGYVREKDVLFGNGDTEDFRFLASMRDTGCKYVISNHITYIAH